MCVCVCVCVCSVFCMGKRTVNNILSKCTFLKFSTTGKSSFHSLSSLLCLLVNAWKYLTMMIMTFTELECKKLRIS